MVNSLMDYTKEQVFAIWQKLFKNIDSKSRINYMPMILEIADSYPDRQSLTINYWDIDFFDADFADGLIQSPETIIKQGEEAIKELLPTDQIEAGCEIKLRIVNLPDGQKILRSKLRSEHLGQLVAIEGMVKKALDVKPMLIEAIFQCKRCYAVFKLKQKGLTYREPDECPKEEGGCGRAAASTAFDLLSDPVKAKSKGASQFLDFQKMEIEERPEILKPGTEPQKIEVHISKDIVGNVMPGDRVVVNGILKAVQKLTKFKTKSTLFDLYVDANSIETEERAFEDIKLTDEDVKRIKKEAKNEKVFEKITQSISPSMYGLEKIKQAIALQLFGGVTKDEFKDGTKRRGEIHILLIGDPGIGKSELIQDAVQLSPRGVYASGKSSSGAGLTASAIRDEFSEGRFSLEAGALVLASKGLAGVDEIDKIDEKDRGNLHEAMEHGRITVHKGGINASLPADCSMLAGGNPKYGRFDSYKSLAEQIDLEPALLSRFDVIFKMQDMPNKEEDLNLAEHIVKTHQLGEMQKNIKFSKKSKFTPKEIEKQMEMIDPPFEREFLRKYVAYAKLNIFPVLTDEAMQLLADFYVTLRTQTENVEQSGKKLPVGATPRQLEGAIRLAEASARSRLSETVDAIDVERSIKITIEFLKQSASEGGYFDIDMITTGISQDQRTRIIKIVGIQGELQNLQKSGTVNEDDLIIECEKSGMDRTKITSDITRLINEGRIFRTPDGRLKLN